MRSLIVITLAVVLCGVAFARDDGRYADSPLKAWFDQLSSHKGNCCSFADGISIKDVDWDTKEVCENGKSGGDGNSFVPVCTIRYRVNLDGQWILVPDDAVVTEPNRFGPAIVWPYYSGPNNEILIRCFLPSAMG